MNNYTCFLSIILILGCFNLKKDKKHQYLLEEGFSGLVFIELNKKGYPPLISNDTVMLIEVPNTGILETSTTYSEFVEFGNWSNVKWKNAKPNHPFEIRSRKYGYFQTKENVKVDTTFDSKGNIMNFRRSGTASDFNYVCFYVNFNPTELNWKKMIKTHIKQKKDCKSIIKKRSYKVY